MLLALLLACARPAPPSPAPPAPPPDFRQELLHGGPLASRLSREPAELVLLYTGEQRGRLGPCGCPRERRGGLPRLATVVSAISETGPVLLLQAGGWLDDSVGPDGELRGDARIRDRAMLRGMAELPWDAVNLGAGDLPGLARLGDGGLPLLSTNLEVRDGSFPAAPWLRLERGGLDVAVLGMAAPETSAVPTPGLRLLEPGPAVEQALERLAEDPPELVVLLAYHAIDAARALALAHPEIDLVVDAFDHQALVPPFRVGDALWVKSSFEGQRLGELRLRVRDGRIAGAVDRQWVLDPELPSEPRLLDLASRSLAEIQAWDAAPWRP